MMKLIGLMLTSMGFGAALTIAITKPPVVAALISKLLAVLPLLPRV
jgi:hypothetical protein